MENIKPNSSTFNFKVGDRIKITTRDPQEKKVHATPFEGLVISIRGTGTGKTFTMRKIGADHVAVERIFPFNSPYIQDIVIIKQNKYRRAKLYYTRNSLTSS